MLKTARGKHVSWAGDMGEHVNLGKFCPSVGPKYVTRQRGLVGGEAQRLGTRQYRLFIQAMPSCRNRCPGTADQGKVVMATKVFACGYLLKLNSGL